MTSQFPASISVFFPAYNDAPSLPDLIARAFRTLDACAGDYEVIVVNDGSQDHTAEVLQTLQARYGPRLRVVTHPRNLGYGAALRSGFAAATKELVFYTDGDGQYDVGELPRLLARLDHRTGFVNGYKLERCDPRHRVWIGNVYNRFAARMFGIQIRDIDCDFRLIRRQLLEQIELQSTSGTVCVELVRKLEMSGWEFEEVGVHHYPRLHGRSQFFRARSPLVTAVQLIRLWFTLVAVPALARRVPRTA
ncbi:MAG: glycosyltransferase family 2 protein [Bryobacteraceae bacterium]